MKILLTNDDGIHAEGLAALRDAVAEFGDVLIVAPETEQSATGHSITLHEPLRVRPAGRGSARRAYALRGTPADCVKIAVRAILKGLPDLLISGINPGPNLGVSMLYSGTVSAALEGASLGIQSMAVSLAVDSGVVPDYAPALDRVRHLVGWIKRRSLPKGTALNVNVPPIDSRRISGIRLTRQGRSRFEEFFDRRIDPRKKAYYWLDGDLVELEQGDDVDYVAVRKGFVSVTPIHTDLTDYRQLDKLRDLSDDPLPSRPAEPEYSEGADGHP